MGLTGFQVKVLVSADLRSFLNTLRRTCFVLFLLFPSLEAVQIPWGVCACKCVSVCVCVCERERDRDRERRKAVEFIFMGSQGFMGKMGLGGKPVCRRQVHKWNLH